MKNRPEIDGLRTVAVLPVILFHAGFEVFSGGFVGVDVFFVISGFLITGILIGEMERGDFSIVRFYERRARRILPALFVVMAATVPFALWWMLPAQREEYAHSVVAVGFFVSNILFWSEEGYFAAAAELKPLLHTWSLAVEEQYYLLFPVLLALLWRFGRQRVLWVVAAIAVASLGWAEIASRTAPSANFYLAPSRVWELLAGSVCAFMSVGRDRRSNNTLAALGLGLVVASIFVFDDATRFPSLYALAPVVGTALIILYAAETTWTARLLSTRPFVAIGLISYSAYLWHQPLFAFARIRIIGGPEPWMMMALAVLSLLLAWATWAFVENPFRRRPRPLLPGRPALFAASGALAAAFVAAGVWIGSTTVPENLAVESTGGGSCNVDRKDCYHVADATRRVAVWGDSFADAFAISLGRRLNAEGIDMGLFIYNSCPSLLGVRRNEDDRLGTGFGAKCQANNDAAARQIVEDGYDTVVLTSAYLWYASARNGRKEPILVEDPLTGEAPDTTVPRALARTAKRLTDAGLAVVVVTPHPIVSGFQAKKMAVFFGDEDQIFADYSSAARFRELLVTALDGAGVPYDEVKGLDFFCENGRCPIVTETGDFLLFDGSHISTNLSGAVADGVAKAIARVEQTAQVRPASQ